MRVIGYAAVGLECAASKEAVNVHSSSYERKASVERVYGAFLRLSFSALIGGLPARTVLALNELLRLTPCHGAIKSTRR